MSVPKNVTDEAALRVVRAVLEVGGEARFEQIEKGTHTTTSTTVGYINGAIKRGWLTKTGLPKSRAVRYNVTDAGRKAAGPATGGPMTVQLGSAPDPDTLVTESSRVRILSAIASEGPFGTLDDLMRSIPDVDGHNMMHLLYALSKDGLVRFREQKMGAHQRLVDIEATKRGYFRAGVPARPVVAEVGRAKAAPSQHPGDGTDFRNHHSRAEGGPIERRFVIEDALAPGEVVLPTRAPEPAPEPEAAPRGTESVPGDRPARWPITRALFARFQHNADITEAARLLEQAGQDDLALAALATIEPFTDIEREAMEMLTLIDTFSV